MRAGLYRRHGKRLLDLGLVAVALPLALPLGVLAWALTVIGTRGSGIFVQERVGRHMAPLRVAKIRTMRTGDPTAHEAWSTVTARGDDRVTRLGAFLRRSKLDELPQLWNVVRGEMSVVGPRPDVREWVDRRYDAFSAALQVRPGLTSLASVAFVREEDLLATYPDAEHAYLHEVLPRELALDIAYARNVSFGLDVRVVSLTALSFVWPTYAAQRAGRLAVRLGADPPLVTTDGIRATRPSL